MIAIPQGEDTAHLIPAAAATATGEEEEASETGRLPGLNADNMKEQG